MIVKKIAIMADILSGKLATKITRILGKKFHWQRFGGQASTNQHYLLETASDHFILRLNASAQRAFGVCRWAEHKVLSAISVYRWSPDIIENHPDEGWCLMKYHGQSLENSPPYNADSAKQGNAITRQLVVAICQMQRIETGLAFDYGRLIDRYRGNLSCLTASQASGEWKQQLKELQQLLGRFSKVSGCLVHHDLHPANLCWQNEPQRLVVIDWEYAGIGNPWLDNAQLLKHKLITRRQLKCLPSVQHTQEHEVDLFLQDAKRFNELLEILWWKTRLPIEM